MEFRLTAEEAALRDEVQTFLQDELPPERQESVLGGEWSTDEEFTFAVHFNHWLARRGWLTAHWPKEYGG